MQITSWVAALISAYCWAFATRYESVTVIKALALQLQCTLRCGLSSISCYDIEQVRDALIWEVMDQHVVSSPWQVLHVSEALYACAACQHNKCEFLPCF